MKLWWNNNTIGRRDTHMYFNFAMWYLESVQDSVNNNNNKKKAMEYLFSQTWTFTVLTKINKYILLISAPTHSTGLSRHMQASSSQPKGHNFHVTFLSVKYLHYNHNSSKLQLWKLWSNNNNSFMVVDHNNMKMY